MVTVSIISGVSMPIIDEKRLGKPPLPSGGLPHLTSLYLSTPMGYGKYTQNPNPIFKNNKLLYKVYQECQNTFDVLGKKSKQY